MQPIHIGSLSQKPPGLAIFQAGRLGVGEHFCAKGQELLTKRLGVRNQGNEIFALAQNTKRNALGKGIGIAQILA